MPRFLDAIGSNSSAQRAAHHRFMAITPRSNSTRSESAAPHDVANRSTPRENFPVPRERARDPSLEATSSDGIAEGVVRVVENNGTTRTFAPAILEANATGEHGPVAPRGLRRTLPD